jgi:hypothetical protein
MSHLEESVSHNSVSDTSDRQRSRTWKSESVTTQSELSQFSGRDLDGSELLDARHVAGRPLRVRVGGGRRQVRRGHEPRRRHRRVLPQRALSCIAENPSPHLNE